jgi:hypothetical protein
MRLCPLFPAPLLYPSDSTRQRPMRAGMRGLRHKSRHKIPRGRGPGRVVQRGGRTSPETPFRPFLHSAFCFIIFGPSRQHFVSRRVGFFICASPSLGRRISCSAISAAFRDEQMRVRVSVRQQGLYPPWQHAPACRILGPTSYSVRRAWWTRSVPGDEPAFLPTPTAERRKRTGP